jgi:hypothetical protein
MDFFSLCIPPQNESSSSQPATNRNYLPLPIINLGIVSYFVLLFSIVISFAWTWFRIVSYLQINKN